MDSFVELISSFTSWLGQVWRGEAYSLLSRQIIHEREEAGKRELELKQRISYLEKQIEGYQDRILSLKGVQPINAPKQERKPTQQRQSPIQVAIENGYKEKYGVGRDEINKLALARAWKAKNLPGEPPDPTNLDPQDEYDEEEEIA